MAAVTPDEPKKTGPGTTNNEILRLSGPQTSPAPVPKKVEPPTKTSPPTKSSAKPKLRKKTLEALARLERKLK